MFCYESWRREERMIALMSWVSCIVYSSEVVDEKDEGIHSS